MAQTTKYDDSMVVDTHDDTYTFMATEKNSIIVSRGGFRYVVARGRNAFWRPLMHK